MMNKMKTHAGYYKKIIFIILFSLFIVPTGICNYDYKFQLDYCCFMADDKDKSCLELYFQFYNSDINFVKNNDKFEANIEVTIVVYDLQSNYITETSINKEIVSDDYYFTIDNTKKNIVQFNFILNPQKYKLNIFYIDKHTNKTVKLDKKVEVKKFDEDTLTISDIQIALYIGPCTDTLDLVKNNKKIISNPSRSFTYNNTLAHFYFEIYNLLYNRRNLNNIFTFNYYITNENKDTLKNFSQSYIKPFKDTAINFDISTKNFKAGKYNLLIEIEDNDARITKTTQTCFYVLRSPIDIKFNDFEQLVDMISVIAARKEINKLTHVSENERQKALLSFWKSKDPTPETSRNETMSEFFERIAYTNQKFAHLGKDGWKTDRGKTYIQYGPPDRIDQQAENKNWSQYEIWEYYNKQIKFVFFDQHGFGDYRLLTNGKL